MLMHVNQAFYRTNCLFFSWRWVLTTDSAPDSQTHSDSTMELGSSLTCHSFQVTLERGVSFLYKR